MVNETYLKLDKETVQILQEMDPNCISCVRTNGTVIVKLEKALAKRETMVSSIVSLFDEHWFRRKFKRQVCFQQK